MATTYVEITENDICIYGKPKGRDANCETVFFSMPDEIFDSFDAVKLTGLPKIRNIKWISQVVIIANTRKALIRISDIDDAEERTGLMVFLPRGVAEFLRNKKRQQQNTEWEMVSAAYPISDKMNEKTHIFDGCFFSADSNGGTRSCFFMAALPLSMADVMSKIAALLCGNVHAVNRLDVIEHVLFRHFSALGKEPLCIVFPQGEGLCILHMTKGLPKWAYAISNHDEFREDELYRVWKELKLTTSVETEVAELKDNTGGNLSSLKVVLLDRNDGYDAICISNFFMERGVTVSTETFDMMKFVGQ